MILLNSIFGPVLCWTDGLNLSNFFFLDDRAQKTEGAWPCQISAASFQGCAVAQEKAGARSVLDPQPAPNSVFGPGRSGTILDLCTPLPISTNSRYMDVKRLAQVYVRETVQSHGIPIDIMSNRDRKI